MNKGEIVGLVNEQNMISAHEPLTEAGEELGTVDIGKQLERVKWFLWQTVKVFFTLSRGRTGI